MHKGIFNAPAWGKKSGKELFFKLSFCFHRLREHVADKSKLPILIFPEGKKLNYLSPFGVDVIPVLFSWLLLLKSIFTSGFNFVRVFLVFIFKMSIHGDNIILSLDVASPDRSCRQKKWKIVYFALRLLICFPTDLTSA